MSVSDAARGGRQESLLALRDRLAAAIDGADGRELPALSKQFVEVLRELALVAEPERGSELDRLRARRAAGRSASAGGVGPAV